MFVLDISRMGVRPYDVPGSRPASQLTDGGIYIHACVCSAAALVVRASSLGLNLHVCARADRSHAAPHTHTHGVLAYGPRPARRTHARTPVLPRAARIRMRLRTLRGETGDRPIHRRLLYWPCMCTYTYYTCWCPCVMRERAVAWGAMRLRLDDETWVDVADGWMDGWMYHVHRSTGAQVGGIWWGSCYYYYYACMHRSAAVSIEFNRGVWRHAHKLRRCVRSPPLAFVAADAGPTTTQTPHCPELHLEYHLSFSLSPSLSLAISAL